MNLKHLSQTIAALAVCATAGTVLANDIHYPEGPPSNASDSAMPKKTREQVRAELQQAYQQGLLNQNDEVSYPQLPPTASVRSREEVRNEAIQYARTRKINPDYDLGG